MADRPSTQPISASPEDSAGYRRSSSGRRRGGSPGSAPRMIGINLILAVLVVGLVIAGWFIASQHQLLIDEQEALNAAQGRIAVLEDRLMVTDQAMTQTGQNTQQQLGFWEDEIRKLWAVSNERNRKWIKDNEAAVENLIATIGKLDSRNTQLSASVGRHESAFQQQQNIIDQLTSLEMQIQRMVSSQRDLVDKVNAASQTVASLQAGLANRVSENEQAVASIDAYRVQLNSRLANIERRLDGLTGNPTL